MADELPRIDYIAKAELAEDQAAKTADVVRKSSLLKMAKQYRSLAKFVSRGTNGICWNDQAVR